MNYIMCPKCGRRLCRGESGTKVEIECPKCGVVTSVTISNEGILLKNSHLVDVKKVTTQRV